jgi:regulator of protease activity HflC (stomatin/prohibitin superfamily)
MDFHLDRADKKLKDQRKVREQKRKAELAKQKQIKEKARKQQQEMEVRLAAARLQKQQELEDAERRKMEEDLLTGGIEYGEVLRATALEGGGASDKVVLPQSALQKLTSAGVFDQDGAMFFELTTREGGRTHCGVREFVAEDGTIGLPPRVAACLGAVTTADDASADTWSSRVNVKYVRLDKGTKVVLQPHTADFQKDADEATGAAARVGEEVVEVDEAVVATLVSMGFDENGSKRAVIAVERDAATRSGSAAITADEIVPRAVAWLMAPVRTTSELSEPLAEGLQAVLERNLHNCTALTVGDTITVQHAGKAYDLTVQHLEPDSKVSLVDTELELEIAPSREYEAAMAAKAAEEARAAAEEEARRAAERAEHAAAEAAAAAEAQAQIEAAERRASRAQEARARLEAVPEPGGGETEGVVSCAVRLPDGSRLARRLRVSDNTALLFDLVDGAGCDDPLALEPYQLTTRYPRIVVRDTRAQGGVVSLADAGVGGERQAQFFLEAAERAATPPGVAMQVDEEPS